ncbi:MAG TPA: sulfite reductase subunit alpha, partial [Tepidisphaeraceae bacterium]|nr:sulfite reductase subunit alpha [Tepidisphaeraceae bacterium]
MGGGENMSVGGAPPAVEPEEDFPWHDPALGLDERLAMAEGKPQPRRLMAAMAQLDCGQCGYLCQTYAEAIAAGGEKDLSRCAPGGRDTQKKLKELVTTLGVNGKSTVSIATPAKATATATALHAGDDLARLVRCVRLNEPGSDKDTRHVEFDLTNTALTYKPGDALGVHAENDPDAVVAVLEAVSGSGAEDVPSAHPGGPSLSSYEALLRERTITRPAPEVVDLLAAAATDASEAAGLKELYEDDRGVDGLELVDLLRLYPSARPPIADLVASLTPLRPRLYSISSSPRAHANQVHVTVGVVRYRNRRDRRCGGVASTFLADRIRPGQKVRVFVHTSTKFALPADGSVSIIMVGPGTGIAPFRAFLHDRRATAATGKNWLLFGDQKQACDFLYRAELEQLQRDGVLTRLDTAFSRDQREKVYVQHRMLQNAAELWAWLNDGAHFYVCGDAKRMAKDVDDALKRVVAEQGGMNDAAAAAFVADLAKAGRYQRDVY